MEVVSHLVLGLEYIHRQDTRSIYRRERDITMTMNMRSKAEEMIMNREDKDDDQNNVCNYGFSSLLVSKNSDFLLSPTGNQVKVSDLEGKVVGLYFSANWYQPCCNFTSVLADVYEHLKGTDQGVGFEIVFVSSDEDLNAFDKYRASMPWLSIPFSDLESKKALSRRFDVEGIPCLVILQPDDNEDNATLSDGVDLIYRYGVRAFPFTKERLKELEKEEKKRHESQTITSLLTSHDRDFLLMKTHHSSPKQVKVASLEGKTIGLYFSAQWCIPGHKFTPRLITIYQKINQGLEEQNAKDFEIVLISSDQNESEFNTYIETMPWLALPFGDPTIKNLTKYFDVQGIPCLVIIGPDGKTLTKEGRNLINLYMDKAYPFTDAQLSLLVKEMNEEAKNLPKTEYHSGHRHELALVSEGTGGGPFICCDCEEQGLGWAYLCLDCGYEVHPKCVKTVIQIES